MFFTLTSLLLPPLLVFGVYHLLAWVNFLNLNSRVYWKRVAWASAVSHILLATGFFVFSYFEYRANTRLDTAGWSFGAYLFNRSEFWRLMLIFDTVPTLVILGLFALLDRLGVNPPQLLILTIAITYIAGTLQWFLLGGGIGTLLEKFWSGLKTGDEEDEDWL